MELFPNAQEITESMACLQVRAARAAPALVGSRLPQPARAPRLCSLRERAGCCVATRPL